jgi:uncharacterized membrane protein
MSSAPSLGPSATRAWRRSGDGRNGPSLPKGYDVLARAGWFPIVTGVQEVADLIAGFSAPSGYGHNYAIDFVSGWAAVAPPVRWTEADSARLQQHLAPE